MITRHQDSYRLLQEMRAKQGLPEKEKHLFSVTVFVFVCLFVFSTTSQQIIDAGCVTCNAIVLLVVGKFSYFSWLYVDLSRRLVGWSKENDRIHSSMNFLMFNRNSIYEGKNKLVLILEQIQLFNMFFLWVCLFVLSLSDLTGDSTHVVLSNCSKTTAMVAFPFI